MVIESNLPRVFNLKKLTPFDYYLNILATIQETRLSL